MIGAGLGRDVRSVRWRVAGRIAVAWLITLPAAGAVAALAELVARLGVIGVAIDAIVGVGVTVFIFIRSRRTVVAHHNVTAAAESGERPKAARGKAVVR